MPDKRITVKRRKRYVRTRDAVVGVERKLQSNSFKGRLGSLLFVKIKTS